MLRTFLIAAGLAIAWTLMVVLAVVIEASWFAEPNIIRGNVSSLQDHLHTHLEMVSAEGRIGAASLVLIHNGEIVFERGYGVANLSSGATVDPESTLFQVGSVSKAVTAFGLMKLVQDGKIGLDDPVMKLLKRWRFAGSDERRDRVTVRQLMSHTSGVDDPERDGDTSVDEPALTLEEYLSGTDQARGARVSREPGTSFVYGNAASGILQLLIEDITGQTFSIYMSESVLRPLGMSHSTFDLDNAHDRLAPAFDASVSAQSPRRHPAAGAVALYTSGRDLARFAQALGGDNAVLSEENVRSMSTPATGAGDEWGLGLDLFTSNDRGGHVVGHDGGARPSWGGVVRFNPATRNGMVMTVSGGRGAANQLEHDWVYWETGKLTAEAHRQVAYGRAREAGLAIIVGALVIAAFTIFRYRTRRRLSRG
ncbi:MAG TPA: serine hydrolase domain-containing protein [Pyrinomonadaceae bacterium]|nr:serine hydrolase domain-containing protein [Pyrinomonadaceae bacterium]